MENKKKLLAVLTAFVVTLGGSAQSLPSSFTNAPLPCRANEQINEFFRQNPQALQRHLRPAKVRAKAEKQSAYVIPVVFHIFGEDFNGMHVTDAIVREALKKTNEDYQGITANTGDDNYDFSKLQRNADITFKLAEIGPNGEATTGIIYHRLERGFGNYYAPRMALYAWDNTKYMNVYVMNDLYDDGVTNNSGVSWYPDIEMTKQNIARVVYNGAYLGSNTDENFRRVLTHEFGHFLNLAHTFDNNGGKWPDGCKANAKGEANPGDWVDDTPKADKALMGATDLNCEGQLTNWTNYMNYSYVRTSMFTEGQVKRMYDALYDESRVSLWQPDNHQKVFFADESTIRIALTSRGDITETAANDGSFDKKYEFTLFNGTLANKQFTQGTDYVIEGLPAGLQPVLTRVSDTGLTLSFTGQASSFNSNDTISVNFKSSVLASGSLYDCKIPLILVNRDAYTIEYTDCDNVDISAANGWKYLQLSKTFDDSKYGVMWNSNEGEYKGNLYIESYGKQMVGNGTNLAIVNYGDEIGASSKWTTALGDYPNLGTLVSPSYSDWKGKTGFVGIQFAGNASGDILYGWMRISVSSDGKSFTLLDYAFNTQPGAKILAGQKSMAPLAGAEVVFTSNVITEDNDANDGSIAQKVKILLMGKNQFASTGKLTAGSQFTLTAPAGLTPNIEVVSPSEASLSFSGKAVKHAAADIDVANLTILPAAFTNADIANNSVDLTFNFIDPFKIVNADLSSVAAGGSYGNWLFFRVPEDSENEFGAWEFEANHLKIETYKKPMVCLSGTRNIEPIAKGTYIGAKSNWVVPGDYPNQLDLATSTFTAWKGRTAYAGFTFLSLGKPVYGWFEITVTSDGSQFTVNKYAYNENPRQGILAGMLAAAEEAGISSPQLQEVSVYPNPASSTLYVSAPVGTQVSICNIAGVVAWKGVTDTPKMEIPVSSWAKGMYVVGLTRNGIHAFQKIIVK